MVIGCVSGYSFAQIEPYVISLERSGFKGDKIMLAWNLKKDVVDKLGFLGWYVMSMGATLPSGDFVSGVPHYRIVVERFRMMYSILIWNRPIFAKYRYIITTDVKDVVFQYDPSNWLDKNEGPQLHVGSECLQYKDEPWGDDNMRTSFPQHYADMREKIIYNCGTITATPSALEELSYAIRSLCDISPVHNPDQAALNILLSEDRWKEITKFNTLQDGYAAQLGTTNDPRKIDAFRPYLLEDRLPFIGHDGIVRVSHDAGGDKIIPCLVHQYDRIPEWKKLIEAKYKE